MELTERKKKVLRSIVDLYIRTAEPVGSKAIAELPDISYSSATIRNEMAELTTLGFLEQPHTSAGRVPSASGYRLYVDELMQDYRLSMDEANSIHEAIDEKMQRVDKMIEKVAKLVSQATDLPAISAASRQGGVTVKRFDLILAGNGSFILVMMLSSDEVVNKLIKLPVNVGENELKLLSALLNATMADLNEPEITPALMDRVMHSAGPAASLVPVIVDFTAEVLRRSTSTNMAVAGRARLLQQPEYQNIEKAQRMLTTLDEETLGNLPAVMHYESPISLVSLRDYAMTEQDRWHYFSFPDGHIATTYLDPADGRSKSSLHDLIAYSYEVRCADVLLQIAPLFIADRFDQTAVQDLAKARIYAVWSKDAVLCYNDAGLRLELKEKKGR